MKVIRQIENIPTDWVKPVLTIGNFDGVHCGHQEVLARLMVLKREHHGTSVVITFRPHPIKILHPERAPQLICTYDEKLALLEKQGVDAVVEIGFDRDFSEWSAQRFVEELLIERMAVHFVLAGPDSHFGRNRAGDAALLESYGAQHGFGVERLTSHLRGGSVVSSSRIRTLIAQDGDAQGTAALLGRAFRLTGTVTKGDQRGRQLGFPTANLQLHTELLPSHGVYAAWAYRRDGVPIQAAVNVGIRPTFGQEALTVEAHLLDFSADLYGEVVHLDLVARIRGECRFDDVNELVRQIEQDVQHVRDQLT